MAGDLVQALVKSWTQPTNRDFAQQLNNLNSSDFIEHLVGKTGPCWTINHTKSINFCLQVCTSQWFQPVFKKCKDSDGFKNLLIKMCRDVSVLSEIPELPDSEIYEYTKTDFPCCAEQSICALQFFKTFLLLLKDTKEDELLDCVMKEMIHFVVTLIANNSEDLPWTNQKSIEISQDVKQVLLKVFEVESFSKLLQSSPSCSQANLETFDANNSILKLTLLYLLPRLRRGIWKRNPSYTHSFCICLFSTKHFYLGEYLDEFIPVALLMVDDHMAGNKISGIKCLSHIIENSSRTELVWQGRAEVIYEALKLQLYSKEVDLLDIALPSMLGILNVLEPSMISIESWKSNYLMDNRPRKYDEIFTMILFNAETESLLVLRRVYTKYLDSFIYRMGINVVKHSKRILNLISSYLEVADGPSETARFNTLQILRAYIHQAWPRITQHWPAIMKCLLRLIYDILNDRSLTSDSVKNSLLNKTKDCILLFKTICRTEVENCLKQLLTEETTPQFKETLSNIL